MRNSSATALKPPADAHAHPSPEKRSPDIASAIWHILFGNIRHDARAPAQRGHVQAVRNLGDAIHQAKQLERVVAQFVHTYRRANRRARGLKGLDLGDRASMARIYDAMSADSELCIALIEEMSAIISAAPSK